MTQQNMTTFSSVGEVMTERLVKTDVVCEVHNVNLVTAFGREPVCLECAKEKRDAEHETLQEELTNRHLKRSTYDWLKQKSIYLDETLDSATFDSFKTEDRETKENKETALNIAREYYKGASYNTILSGKAGTGKSHLAMSILKVVNEHSKPYKKCLFISIDELMRRIKDSFSNKDSIHTEQRMAEMLIEADLLVIDDLGAETGSIHSEKSATDFTTRTLYGIINGRMKKPTIITTNLSSKEMAQMYDSKLISRMFRGAKGHVISFKETDDKRIDIEF